MRYDDFCLNKIKIKINFWRFKCLRKAHMHHIVILIRLTCGIAIGSVFYKLSDNIQVAFLHSGEHWS